jgi:hypothetical protein
VLVDLGSQRELHVSLAVGSFKKGVDGPPRYWSAYVMKAGGSPESIRSLAAIPSAIRRVPDSMGRLPNNRMEPARPQSRAFISPRRAAHSSR